MVLLLSSRAGSLDWAGKGATPPPEKRSWFASLSSLEWRGVGGESVHG